MDRATEDDRNLRVTLEVKLVNFFASKSEICKMNHWIGD
jgi:hypothetical protein